MFTYAAIFSYCLTTNTSFIFRSSTSRGRYIRGITDTYFSFWLRSLGSATVHRQLPSHLLPLHQTPPCPPSPGPWTLTSSSTASSSQLMFKQSPPRLINFPLQLPVFDTVTSETSPTEPLSHYYSLSHTSADTCRFLLHSTLPAASWVALSCITATYWLSMFNLVSWTNCKGKTYKHTTTHLHFDWPRELFWYDWMFKNILFISQSYLPGLPNAYSYTEETATTHCPPVIFQYWLYIIIFQ